MISNAAWISPYGGLGDTLMLSGVLKQVYDRDPSTQYNLITRTKYPPLLAGHPAIQHIGHPPPDAPIIHADYWSKSEYKSGQWRAYQVIANIFGLPTPIDELLYLPGELIADPILLAQLPQARPRIAISPTADSPRKQWPLANWEQLVQQLKHLGIAVVQFGKRTDPYIRGAHSLLGITSPRQAMALLQTMDGLIGQDSFFMHVAHLLNIPALILWGGTHSDIYGYATQTHLAAARQCAYPRGCLGKMAYTDICPQTNFCMADITVEEVLQHIQNLHRTSTTSIIEVTL